MAPVRCDKEWRLQLVVGLLDVCSCLGDLVSLQPCPALLVEKALLLLCV